MHTRLLKLLPVTCSLLHIISFGSGSEFVFAATTFVFCGALVSVASWLWTVGWAAQLANRAEIQINVFILIIVIFTPAEL